MHEQEAGSTAAARVLAFRGADEEPAGRDDRIAVEAPLEVRFGKKAATVLMRTPGADEELVRGFLFSEGVVARAEDIVALRRPPGLAGAELGNVIVVDIDPARPRPSLERQFYGSSSCGACGKLSIASLAVEGRPATSLLTVSQGVLGALPDRMRAAQTTFHETGGVHASALFTAEGELLCVREDVGRHNALDKLIGWGLAEGALPFAERILLVSGRVSYEIVQKAVAAGLPVIAAVGAPSTYAVDLALRFGITLAGFVRAESMNVYAHAERIVGAPSSVAGGGPRTRR